MSEPLATFEYHVAEADRQRGYHIPHRVLRDMAQSYARLQEQLEAVTRERDELRSTFVARIQDMSERFRAVNVAEALRQLGPDRLAQIERAEAAVARAARLEALAERVCWFDWSDNDEDAVKAVSDLRAALDVKGAG